MIASLRSVNRLSEFFTSNYRDRFPIVTPCCVPFIPSSLLNKFVDTHICVTHPCMLQMIASRQFTHTPTHCTYSALYCNCLISHEHCFDLHTFEMAVLLKEISSVSFLWADDFLLNTELGFCAALWHFPCSFTSQNAAIFTCLSNPVEGIQR